jgi:hypothetical protein
MTASTTENEQSFYTPQTSFTDPGELAHLYDTLPPLNADGTPQIDALCVIVRGIYVHYMASRSPQDEERRKEVDLRYAHARLSRVLEIDPSPITQERPVSNRVVGCCHDAALTLVSLLRHQGIPARNRVGFATYIRLPGGEGFHVDHVVAEYWNVVQQRWILVDPEQDEWLIQHNSIDFDVHDIPRDRFLVGGAVWQQCRIGEASADAFGGSPEDDFFRGMWPIRVRMLNDLCTLNRVELLLWDTWGWMDYGLELDDDKLSLMDELAALTADYPMDFAAVRAFWLEHPEFQAPDEVMCYSPIVEPFEVRVRY